MGSVKLQDRFGRAIDYLRLSVTDRCDCAAAIACPRAFAAMKSRRTG
jgi:cyclic pyranopterin phosphate synthase